MKRFTSPLRNVKVASPCPADWDRMIGDERARFCGQCELNVYNLSAMSTLEAESLIARTEGRLCVRYYRRKDGSIITQDCPVGFAQVESTRSGNQKGRGVSGAWLSRRAWFSWRCKPVRRLPSRSGRQLGHAWRDDRRYGGAGDSRTRHRCGTVGIAGNPAPRVTKAETSQLIP